MNSSSLRVYAILRAVLIFWTVSRVERVGGGEYSLVDCGEGSRDMILGRGTGRGCSVVSKSQQSRYYRRL